MTPKVSICIPAYEQTEYLKRTLDSILAQDYQDYELIISDDSPDAGVEELISQYEFGSRVKYFRNSPPLGSPENWNHAVRLSCGEYIKVLHHDDWFEGPSSLSEFVWMLDSNPDAGFGFSGSMVRSASSGRTWHHCASDREVALLGNEPTCLFYGNFIGPPSSTIIRRATFSDYNKHLIWIVDIAQYIEILKSTGFVFTQKALMVSTTNADHQITSTCIGNAQLNIFEFFYLFDEIKASIPVDRRQNYIRHLIEVVYKHNVQSVEEIHKSGYAGDIPAEIISSLESSSLARRWLLFRLRLSRRLRNFVRSASRSFLGTVS